jgi:hypothetical protein|tara:strand:+ start:1925 stop:2347 length:423 start_codon:yes stop_codon:yes gene_type:complete
MKPFDQDLYDKDDSAKHIVIEYLGRHDILARVNPDPYGIDLLADKDGEPYEIEVEVKHNWSGAKFPFSSLHYSDRKTKFLNPKANVKFITLNHEWTHAAIVDGEVLLNCKRVEKKTKYTDQESFIEVPVSKVRWVSIAVV